MAREKEQEKRTTEFLRAREIESRKDGRDGYPDRIVLYGGCAHVWIEHKQDRGRLTPAQARVFPRLEARGDVIIYGKQMTAEDIVRAVLVHSPRLRDIE
jgi:hypothetical protein